jgi:hypothetical protein
MNYFISRAGQQYGPYSLADLQKYVGQGNILLTDLARGEGMEQWVPVQQVIGNIAVPPTPAPTPAPAPANYGQVPAYSPAGFSPQPQPGAAAGPLPPGLHWGLVLLFGILTCGLFSIVWLFVQASFAQKLKVGSKALMFYVIYMVAGLPLVFLTAFLSAAIAAALHSETAAQGVQILIPLVQIGSAVIMIIGHFSLKGALERYYNTVEPINLRLSGVMTFFFNTLYFQYHFTRIRNWKTTGVLQ